MPLAVSLIPFGYLHKVLPPLSQQLQKSEFWTNGRAEVDDIIRFLYNGQMQLWIAHEGSDELLGYIISEIKEYPRCKMLVMQYCAGDFGSLESVGDLMFETLERYAKDAGCAGIEFFGRPGWTPHAKKHGCTVQTVVYEKYFGERT